MKSAQEQSVDGVWSAPGVRGADMGVCRQFGSGNIFFSVPLDRTMLFFSTFVSAGDLGGLVGWAGGLLGLGPTKELPSSKCEDRV